MIDYVFVRTGSGIHGQWIPFKELADQIAPHSPSVTIGEHTYPVLFSGEGEEPLVAAGQELARENARLRTANQVFNTENEKLHAELAQVKSIAEELSALNLDVHKTLAAEREERRIENDMLHASIQAWQRKCDEAREESARRADRLSEAIARNGKLQNEVSNLKGDLANVHPSIKEFSAELDRVQKERDHWASGFTAANQDAEQWKATAENTANMMARVVAERDAWNERVQELQKAIDGWKDKLHQINSKYVRVADENDLMVSILSAMPIGVLKDLMSKGKHLLASGEDWGALLDWVDVYEKRKESRLFVDVHIMRKQMEDAIRQRDDWKDKYYTMSNLYDKLLDKLSKASEALND